MSRWDFEPNYRTMWLTIWRTRLERAGSALSIYGWVISFTYVLGQMLLGLDAPLDILVCGAIQVGFTFHFALSLRDA